MDLCYWCQQFSLHVLAGLPQRTGTFPLSHARQGAAAGCSFCSLLVRFVDKGQQAHHESEERMRIHIQATSSRGDGIGSSRGDDANGVLDIDGLRAFLAPSAYLVDGLKPVEGSLATFNVCADRGGHLLLGKSGR
jgi:hypothetical protein